MANEGALSIISADRLEDSIIIGFSNGQLGRYSTQDLHAMLAQGAEVFESDKVVDFEDSVGSFGATQNDPAI